MATAAPARRHTRRCGWTSTTGGGQVCRSACAPGNGWPARITDVLQFQRPPHLQISAGQVRGLKPDALILHI